MLGADARRRRPSDPCCCDQDGSNAQTIVATRERGVLEMDGPETFRHARRRGWPRSRSRPLRQPGSTLDDDRPVRLPPGQRSGSRASLGQRLELDPERVVDCIAEQGNTSAATLPFALAHAEDDGRLKPATRVLLVAFGAGFTWGGAVLTW